MILLYFITTLSVAYSYEVIPGCLPKMTPVNSTHCRIEYEYCFKDLEPNHKAYLLMFLYQVQKSK